MNAQAATDGSAALPRERRLRHIDALRAIAALLVLWLHVAETFVVLDPSGRSGGRWLYDIVRSIDVGRVGVVTFFLISGFVVPFSLRSDRSAPVAEFVIKRFFRIYPAYWLSVPLGVLSGFWLWGRAFGGRDFLLNLTLLQDLFGAQSAEGLYWTLLVELVFYALCIVLFLARSLDSMRRVCMLAIALGVVFSLAMLMQWQGRPLMSTPAAFWPLNLSIMFCGTLYRRCVVEGGAAQDPLLRAGVAGLFAFYLMVFPFCAVLVAGFERNAAIAYALGVLLFVVGVSVVRIATRLTDWLGRISYSIYLFHPVVFMSLLWWLQRLPATSPWRNLHLGIYLLVNALLTAALATLVYRFVEKPGIELGRRCAARWSRRRPVAAQPLPR
jgi:peptidoglycan/LPS O-acetylase OafA/YrhL